MRRTTGIVWAAAMTVALTLTACEADDDCDVPAGYTGTAAAYDCDDDGHKSGKYKGSKNKGSKPKAPAKPKFGKR